MSFILDAWRALYDPLAIEWLSGETRNKHSRCMDLRARLKRLPLTDAERKAVEIVDIRYARTPSSPWAGPQTRLSKVYRARALF